MIKQILNVGIIGLGVGQHHLRAFNNNKNCKVIAICDLNKDKLQINKKFNSNLILYQKAENLINNKELDIISIASFDNFHYSQVIKSLKNKKHVFIEKPLCLTSAQLKNIKKLIKMNKGLIVSSNMVLRANPRFKFFKKSYQSKKIKDLYYIEADYYWGRLNKLSEWRAKIKSYSIILGASVHLIDLILWILKDKPIYVESFGNRIGANSNMISSNTFSSINLIFKNNLLVKINSHGLCVHPHYHSLKFFSKNSSLFHQFQNSFIVNRPNLDKLIKFKDPYPFKENRSDVIDNFVGTILKQKTKDEFINFQDISDSMSICLSAIKSESTRRKIKIKYI